MPSPSRTTRSNYNKRPHVSSPPIADDEGEGEETCCGSAPTSTIAKVAKLDHPDEDEGVDNDDGDEVVGVATDYGHDGAEDEEGEGAPPMDTNDAATDMPPHLELTTRSARRLPPLSPVTNPIPMTNDNNESIAVATEEVGHNNNDGDEAVPEDENVTSNAATLAVDYNEASPNLDESMPPLPPLPDDINANIKKSRKDRKEFTASEKLQIISEVQTAPSLQAVLDKWGVSKSSLHRWRQPDKLEQLHEMVKVVGGPDNSSMVDGNGGEEGEDNTSNTHSNHNGGNGSNSSTENRDMYRKRIMNDKLRQIKLGLWEFCKDNMNRDEDERYAITSSLIKLKAMQIKEDLLNRHYASQLADLLTDEEVSALKSFLASKSWACQMGNHLGYLSSGSSIQWTSQAKANTALYIEEHSRNPPKPKKQRVEFTAEEKLAIVQELEETNVQNKALRKPAITVEDICRKYDTSKSSVHRWQQQYRAGRLQELATSSSGYSTSKRVFTCKLNVVKQDLNNFYLENESAALDEKVAMTFTTLQSRAIATKESLLERHYAAVAAREVSAKQEQQQQEEDGEGIESNEQHQQQDQALGNRESLDVHAAEDGTNSNIDIMSEEEVTALVNFKASNSWIREVAKKFGWKLDLERRDTTSRSTMIDHSSHAMNIAEDDDGIEQYIAVAREDQEVGLSDAQENVIADILEEQESLDYVVDEHMLVLNEDEHGSNPVNV
ncbi:hypothetical protein ACHAWU_007276 [Discostella pseudostelligera]|uniref:Uncharacterized protein n=1 Tax=Discostella pseudostelligera TaxID=259834 RepID=A0ABD3LX48_9STRA